MSHRSIGIEDARAQLGDLADDAHRDGTVTHLTRYNRHIASIVPAGMKATATPSQAVKAAMDAAWPGLPEGITLGQARRRTIAALNAAHGYLHHGTLHDRLAAIVEDEVPEEFRAQALESAFNAIVECRTRGDRQQDRPATSEAPTRAPQDDPSGEPEPAPAAKGIKTRPQKLARKTAVAIADAAELVRDPNHRDNHRWNLRSGDTVLGYVEPSYGGTSQSGRNGWIGRLASGAAGPRCTTRNEAAVDLAMRWVRVVTTAPKPRTR